jgi:hypothetical protein
LRQFVENATIFAIVLTDTLPLSITTCRKQLLAKQTQVAKSPTKHSKTGD